MNISAIDFNTNIGSINAKREESRLESFQSYLEKAKSDSDNAEIKKACVEFEAYFIKQMFSAMRKTVDSSNSLIPKSNAETIFEDMLDDEISNIAAEAGGIGLSDFMMKQLVKNAE